MKKNILLLLCLAFGVNLFAQVTITPNPVIVSNVMPNDVEGIAHSLAKNTLPQVRTYRWDRSVVQMTEGWTVAVCDKNQCYLPTVASQEFVLGPNEEGTMDVHVYPNGIAGMAIIEVVVTDVNNANNTVTGLYYFNALPTGVNEAIWESIDVYPNPSNGVFTVSENNAASRVLIFDLTGKLLRQFDYATDQWYDIRDLQRGAYLVKLIDRQGAEMINRLVNKL